ncbi:MAG: hypothetical protein IT170_00405 [Bryobacterales bacterium]|nr:hypothetical protein [Bryobacterales bacterium]
MRGRFHPVARFTSMRNSPNPPQTELPAPAGEERKGEDAEPMLHCPVCSRKLLARKCKLYCPQCGYYMSCADYI